MKDQINHLFFISLLALLTTATSCREESDDIILPTEEEALLADSNLADLVLKTTRKSGFDDNILDGTSCYSVQLPVVILIEDIKILVESKNDFEKIEEVFEDLEDDIQDLDFIYPIVLVDADFEEITVDNEDQFDDLIDSCNDKEIIGCIDFSYPITVSVFNRTTELVESIIFNDDKEFNLFIGQLTINDIVNFSFPITMIDASENELNIKDFKDLTKIITDALDDDCEENQTDEDRLVQVLTNAPFEVQKYKDNNSNETKEYEDFIFTFKENGSISVQEDDDDDDLLTGTWSVTSDNILILDFEDDDLEKLNGPWFIKKVHDTRIMLEGLDTSGKSKDQLFFQAVK